MFRPHVARCVFVVSSSGLGRYELEGLLGIWCDADTSADLPESWRSLVDLDVDVGVFEEGDGGA